jgi:hypothetical protein
MQETPVIVLDKNAAYDELKKNNSGLIHISFSELNLFRGCGFRHLIEKYLQLSAQPPSIHLIFGNAVHFGYERKFRDRISLEDAINCFKTEFVREMKSQMSGMPEMIEMDAFIEQGCNIMTMIDSNKLFEKYELVGCEIAVYEVVFGKFRFKGFIDLVLKNRKTGRILICDFKTSSEIWQVDKKKKDKVFMAQMRLYKYFYAKKFNEPIENIDCKYLVLNRLQMKKMPALGFGKLQTVEIFSTHQDILNAITLVANSLRDIHIKKEFKKAKLEGRKQDCYFCPYKNNLKICDNSDDAHKYLLDEHQLRRKQIEQGETVKSIF